MGVGQCFIPETRVAPNPAAPPCHVGLGRNLAAEIKVGLGPSTLAVLVRTPVRRTPIMMSPMQDRAGGVHRWASDCSGRRSSPCEIGGGASGEGAPGTEGMF